MMENGGCSWMTRKKLSPQVYFRSRSSRFPSIRFGFLSYQCRSSQKDSNVHLMTTSSVSEAKEKTQNLNSLRAHSATQLDGKSGRMKKLPKDSNSQTADFRFHPNGGCSLYTLYLKSRSKQRCVSPPPRIILSDVFKEAKSKSRRFSTLPSHGNQPYRNVSGKHPSSCEWSLGRHSSSDEGFPNSSTKKGASWAKCFYNERGSVTAVDTTEKWMVDLSQLYFGARFSAGSHSRLYHGMYKNQRVAVKIIRLPDDDKNGVKATRIGKQFARETNFLSYLFHRNVIKLLGACQKPPIFFIITEYLPGGSLRALLRKLDHNSLPLDELISIALDVARGMEYIHSQGVIHRDLKPENILFDRDFCVKIADFGVACEEAHCDPVEDDAGTYRWMAPEMIKHMPYGRKVDVYSFGLLLWEMVAGAIPFENMTPLQAAFAVVNKNIQPMIPVDCPAVLGALMEQCWSSLPEERPEFWQIVKALEQFEHALASEGTLNQLQIVLPVS